MRSVSILKHICLKKQNKLLRRIITSIPVSMRNRGVTFLFQRLPVFAILHQKSFSYEHRPKSLSKQCNSVHTVKKTFKCKSCPKVFFQSSHLNSHVRTHTGEKPYACDLCTKSFSQSSNLYVHRRTHTGEKPYACDLCTKSFSQRDSLSLHRGTHTGEKSYACDLCTKSFSHRASLSLHMRTHTGE